MKFYYYNVAELIFEINSSKIFYLVAYGLYCLSEVGGGDTGKIGCGSLALMAGFMS